MFNLNKDNITINVQAHKDGVSMKIMTELSELNTFNYVCSASQVLPPSRSNHAMALTPNGQLWIFGGLDATKTTLGDFWTLKEDNFEWQHLSIVSNNDI